MEKHLNIMLVPEHSPEHGDSGCNAIPSVKQPLDLLNEPIGLGGKNLGGYRIAVRGLFNHEGSYVLKGNVFLIDPLNEGFPLVDAVLFADAGPNRSVGAAVEGFRHGPQARLSHGVPAAHIPQEVSPAPNTAGRTVPHPGKHHGARSGNDHKPAARSEGRIQGNMCVVHHLYVNGLCLVREVPTKMTSKGFLFVGPTGPGHPCTDGQLIDGSMRLKSLSD